MRRRGTRPTSIVLDPDPAAVSPDRRETLRRDFVENVGHELKTPVGALVLLAEAMRAEDDPEVLHRLADRVLSEAERMGSLLEDMLEFGRDDEPASWGTRRRVAVRDIIATAVERVRPAAHARDIFLEIQEGPSHVSVFGSRRQLSSALGNLLENAVKYSPEHGRVALRVGLRAGWIELSVSDSGIGIAPDDIEHIFDRYYRGRAALAYEGNGLGLAIVRQVASEHGGEITVYSAEGAGSSFTLGLPAAASALASR